MARPRQATPERVLAPHVRTVEDYRALRAALGRAWPEIRDDVLAGAADFVALPEHDREAKAPDTKSRYRKLLRAVVGDFTPHPDGAAAAERGAASSRLLSAVAASAVSGATTAALVGPGAALAAALAPIILDDAALAPTSITSALEPLDLAA